MRWNKIAGWTVCLIGAVLCALGLLGIGTYVWGVIGILDEPDQSWIFWGLVFLFGGILLVISGTAALILGLKLMRRKG
jgi:hypothetical protein